ncbi:hypothetical protein RSAG8_05441, partial [Rhizoctonia solani AG-8 WAC10335]
MTGPAATAVMTATGDPRPKAPKPRRGGPTSEKSPGYFKSAVFAFEVPFYQRMHCDANIIKSIPAVFGNEVQVSPR